MNFFFTYRRQMRPYSAAPAAVPVATNPTKRIQPTPLHQQIAREMQRPNPFSEIDRKKELILTAPTHPRNIMKQIILANPPAKCGACSKK